ncbi:heavy-metal-associated domain-containing protein [Flammeovirgaceae bacterium SG7u.111]|nr:heavy-metal-associated domain-containing protein [Flammeovirgaceae bacterium SG7u.132]WPO38693.1 heavy-metal-associated domain-containing protein [Flammeovirgaceae bacterium SG7u.111]
MENFKFKTNINCQGCLKTVTPHLNELEDLESWDVDLENSDKILTVNLKSDFKEAVVQAVKKAGFDIERL